MCFGEANIWYKEKTTTNVIRTGAIATKKLPLHWNIEQ